MSAVGDVKVSLVLDGADEFKVQVTRAADSLDKISSKMDGLGRASQRAQHDSWALGSSFREMAFNMELARLTITNLTLGLTALPRAILEQASFFDKTTLLLAGLNVETATFAEAQQKAAVEVRNLMSVASASPYKLNALVDSYTKLKAADLASPDGFLAGLVNTAGKFGKSSEELKRASVAIQQMAGKGVISMEELRQQFGEAVPDAMGMMARAAGISMGDLVKQVSTGTVEAKQALSLLRRTWRNGTHQQWLSEQIFQLLDSLRNRRLSYTEFLCRTLKATFAYYRIQCLQSPVVRAFHVVLRPLRL